LMLASAAVPKISFIFSCTAYCAFAMPRLNDAMTALGL
jgi:hypothetical protein